VAATGEIDGTVYLERDGVLHQAGNVELQLLGEDGEVAASLKSGHDGFYLFSYVMPGRYLLRVAPDQLEKLGLLAEQPQEVVIEADGTILIGMDVVLKRAVDV